jgi:Fe-S cluster biogenesis protein NfuA/nitrite reductase/ring-hydroxylating ferredoxin subunit
MQEDRELIERVSRIEGLLAGLESVPDPTIHARAQEIVESLLLLYGEGLNRVLTVMWDGVDHTTRDQLFQALVGDELVAHLLLLHDLHPVPLEARVLQALEQVRPYLESHGGDVELLGIDDGVARLKLQGSCSGCPSSTMTLKLAIEEAIRKAAPDIDRIEAEGVSEPVSQPINFVSTADLLRTKPASPGPTWETVGDLPQLASGEMTALDVSGSPAIFFNLEGTFYAYQDACPHCGHSLEEGTLHGAAIAEGPISISCPGCNRQYDIRLAGRGIEVPEQHLQPIPLLVQGDTIKVAAHV